VKVEARIKWATDRRRARYRALLESISSTNDTGLSDNTVATILAAKRGPWSKALTLDDLLRSLGIES
jgi:hypothetical protein